MLNSRNEKDTPKSERKKERPRAAKVCEVAPVSLTTRTKERGKRKERNTSIAHLHALVVSVCPPNLNLNPPSLDLSPLFARALQLSGLCMILYELGMPETPRQTNAKHT